MERDDVIEYSLYTHHNEEVGVKKRKEIMKVTVILTLITLIEVLVGVKWGRATVSGGAWEAIKWGYIILTIIKAAYIVMIFMHLGEEKKVLRYFILVPYILFISYLIFQGLYEGTAVGKAWAEYGM